MPTPPNPAPRRRRPRGSLSPELIVEAAEAIAAAGDPLSMRSVAARLDAVPMALYNHYATKDQLVNALLDRVLHRFEPPPETGDWLADLRAFAHAHRRVLADHPWVIPMVFTHPNPGLGAVRIGELALRILRRGGLTNDQMIAAFSGLIALNYGWLAFSVGRAGDPDGPSHTVTEELLRLPADHFPLIVETAEAMGAYGSDEHYDYALGRFLGGLGG